MKTKIFLFLTCLTMFANAQNAKNIVDQYELAMKANDQEATLTMKLISKNGTIRQRTLSWSSQTDANGRNASHILFTAPADIKGSAFLSIENQTGQDDQWLYLPSIKRSRRISSNEKGKSFMGSDFTYEDIGSVKSDENTYKLIGTEKKAGFEIYTIEATYIKPDRHKETGYSRRVFYISSDNYMLLKSEFFGLDGKLKKVLECSDFEYFSEPQKWRPKTLHMKDLDKGTQTILIFSNYSINKGIDPNRFTIRHLETN